MAERGKNYEIQKQEAELHPKGRHRVTVTKVIENEENQYGESVTLVYETEYGEL